MDGQQFPVSRGSNDLTSRDETRRLSSSFLGAVPRNTSSFGPIRSISSLKAHRGPYSRPSALDKDSRYSPYARKPMQVRATKIANETPNINLTSTAERIIQTLANCSTPVVDIKKSPIDSLKSLKPEFPVFRREKSGPPVNRSFDTALKPCKSIMLPADLPELVTEQPRNTTQIDTQSLIAEIFSPVENVNADLDKHAGGGSGHNPEGRDVPESTSTELFDSNGRINLSTVKFEGWSLDKYATNEKIDDDSSDSSSEDEDGNAYIKPPDKVTRQSDKSANVEIKTVTNPPADTKASTQKWECPTCMVSSGMDVATCPCCATPNPHIKSKPAPTTTSSQPTNPSPFVFGFQSGSTAPTKTTTVGSTFKFGEESSKSNPNQLLTNFKMGFNSNSADTSTSGAHATKSTFSFGMNAPNAPSPITFGFGSNPASDKTEDKSKNSSSMQSDVLDFAKKSAKEEVWECPSCMVMNKKSQSKCVCCQELQPAGKPQLTTKSDNILPPSTSQSKPVVFGSTTSASSSMPPPSTTSTPTSILPTKDRPRMVFGLKPEDEISIEAPTEPSKTNSFTGFAFEPLKPSTPPDAKPIPSNEMWSCSLCTAKNGGSNERCSGCGGSKPRLMPQLPRSEAGSQYEKYTFTPFYGIDPNNPNKGKSEPDSSFEPSTLQPQPSVIQQPVTTVSSAGTFNFGAPIASSTPAPIAASTGFKFGTTLSSGEAMKRKADESSETGSNSSGGFNFTGSTEPKLKLRASGSEIPTPAPSFGLLKSGSVLDALKQPGFVNTNKSDVTTPPVAAPTTQLPTTSSFAFPTSTPTPTTTSSIQAPATTPGVFQFGLASTTTNPPPSSGGFTFGQTNAPPPVFGSLAPNQTPAQGGFSFGQPAMQAPVQQNTAFVPPAFSLTPNTNFGAPPAWDASASNPYNFQSTPSQGAGATTPRRIRKAIRRTK